MFRCASIFSAAVLAATLSTPAQAAVAIDANLETMRSLPTATAVRQRVLEFGGPASALIKEFGESFTRAVIVADDPRLAIECRLATDRGPALVAALIAADFEIVEGFGVPAVRHQRRADHVIAAADDRLVVAHQDGVAQALTAPWPAPVQEIISLSWTPVDDGPLAGRLVAADAELLKAGHAKVMLTFENEFIASIALKRIQARMERKEGGPVKQLLAEYTTWDQYGDTLTATTAVPEAEITTALGVAQDHINKLLQALQDARP